MSSLAAAQADGYYLPPEYHESGKYKTQSKNQWHAQHNGGGVAASHNQFAAHNVVRFELPYDGFCNYCGDHVMRGSRFNASKSKTDDVYHSTPIFEFAMKCCLCGKGPWVIRSSPEARGFDYVSGIRVQVGKLRQDRGDILQSSAVASDLERLESARLGEHAAQHNSAGLTMLQASSDAKYLNDAQRNADLRTRLRKERRKRKRRLAQGAELGWREGLALEGGRIEDTSAAKHTTFGKKAKEREAKSWKTKRTSSIFDSRGEAKEGDAHRCSSSREEAYIQAPDRVRLLTVGQTTVKQELDRFRGKDEDRKASKKRTKRLVVKSGVLTSAAECHQAPTALAALASYGSESDSD